MQLLRKLALPLALLYGMVVRIRNFCYDTGIFPSRAYLTPTLCIGNLSVGGTGKTPMVEWMVEHLKKGRKLAVLSRGYQRSTSGFIIAGQDSTAREIGDEPRQLKAKFPGLVVAVDENRQRGIKELESKLAPDLILLDDAFQHRKVRPTVSILLTTYGELYCDDFYLPTGNLRDSRREARRADLIIVTKCPPELPAKEQEQITLKLKPRAHQQVLFASLEYDTELKGDGIARQLDDIKELLLVTGIAKPEPLVSFLKKKGILFEHLSFRDHHYFTDKELKAIGEAPLVLTTEKDYRRIENPPQNLYYIGIRHRFLGRGSALLLERLKAL